MNFFQAISSEPYMLQAFGAVTLTALAIFKLAGGISIFGTAVYLLKGPKTNFQSENATH